jgi:hypothetical protein
MKMSFANLTTKIKRNYLEVMSSIFFYLPLSSSIFLYSSTNDFLLQQFLNHALDVCVAASESL